MSEFEYKDMFGREIKVGDYIVYGAVDGRSGTLRAGQVLELTTTKPDKYFPSQKLEPKIKAKSWSNFRARGWRDDMEYSGRQKNVSLGFLDRLIVVDPSTLSEKVLKDLAGPVCDYMGQPTK